MINCEMECSGECKNCSYYNKKDNSCNWYNAFKHNKR